VWIHLHVITNLLLVTSMFKVCKIAKGQRYSKQLNRGKQMEDFLKVAKQPPHEREKGILRVIMITYICALIILNCSFLFSSSVVCTTVSLRSYCLLLTLPLLLKIIYFSVNRNALVIIYLCIRIVNSFPFHEFIFSFTSDLRLYEIGSYT
jgi:hypothetical protein